MVDSSASSTVLRTFDDIVAVAAFVLVVVAITFSSGIGGDVDGGISSDGVGDSSDVSVGVGVAKVACHEPKVYRKSGK
ncbi:Hypothetical predicted protein [Octopus vulgaris]|uniref:Transmembrane protein n=1 Tax=Octopus vulgaris TaxID=6645 RepID=A0AA36AZI8_OCTVU|nr:Hypothetical predicted protein [Octopus vulgaris]